MVAGGKRPQGVPLDGTYVPYQRIMVQGGRARVTSESRSPALELASSFLTALSERPRGAVGAITLGSCRNVRSRALPPPPARGAARIMPSAPRQDAVRFGGTAARVREAPRARESPRGEGAATRIRWRTRSSARRSRSSTPDSRRGRGARPGKGRRDPEADAALKRSGRGSVLTLAPVASFTPSACAPSLQLGGAVQSDRPRTGQIGDAVHRRVPRRRDAEHRREVRIVPEAVAQVATRLARLLDALGGRLAEGAGVDLVRTEEAGRRRHGHGPARERGEVDRQRRLEAGQPRPALLRRQLAPDRRARRPGVRARRVRVRLPARVTRAAEALRARRGRVAADADIDPRGERQVHRGGARRRVEGAARRRLDGIEDAGRERAEGRRAHDRQRRTEVAVRVQPAGAGGAAAVDVGPTGRRGVVVDVLLPGAGGLRAGLRAGAGVPDQRVAARDAEDRRLAIRDRAARTTVALPPPK